MSHPKQTALIVFISTCAKHRHGVGPAGWDLLQVNPGRLEVIGREHGNKGGGVVGFDGKPNLRTKFTNEVIYLPQMLVGRPVFGQNNVQDRVIAEVEQRRDLKVKRHHSSTVFRRNHLDLTRDLKHGRRGKCMHLHR